MYGDDRTFADWTVRLLLYPLPVTLVLVLLFQNYPLLLTATPVYFLHRQATIPLFHVLGTVALLSFAIPTTILLYLYTMREKLLTEQLRASDDRLRAAERERERLQRIVAEMLTMAGRVQVQVPLDRCFRSQVLEERIRWTDADDGHGVLGFLFGSQQQQSGQRQSLERERKQDARLALSKTPGDASTLPLDSTQERRQSTSPFDCTPAAARPSSMAAPTFVAAKSETSPAPSPVSTAANPINDTAAASSMHASSAPTTRTVSIQSPKSRRSRTSSEKSGDRIGVGVEVVAGVAHPLSPVDTGTGVPPYDVHTAVSMDYDSGDSAKGTAGTRVLRSRARPLI
jgi:hypothetical protein